MLLRIDDASPADAAAIAILRTEVAERLTREYGRGHWSSVVSEDAVARSLKTSRALIARDGQAVVGTLTLITKKPWAIDPALFSPVKKALYLVNMAVAVDRQREGIGRRLIAAALPIAKALPSDAIRLDAYDADAGAGGFYVKCGFREVGRATYRTVPLIYFERLL